MNGVANKLTMAMAAMFHKHLPPGGWSRTVLLLAVIGLTAVILQSTAVGAEKRLAKEVSEVTSESKHKLKPFSRELHAPGVRLRPGDLPDLVVDELKITERGFQDWRLFYQVRNHGTAEVQRAFSLIFLINNERRAGSVVKVEPPVSAGAGRNGMTERGLFRKCRQVEIRAIVDFANEIQELSENNNELRRNLSPLCPDLLVTAVRPRRMEDGRYRIRVTVMNAGDARSPRVSVAVVSGKRRGVPVTALRPDYKKVGPLQPGEKASITVGSKRLSRKNWTVTVSLDDKNQVAESNETNNYVEWKN